MNLHHNKGQHYLLSTAARSMSLVQVARMSDEEALAQFKNIRWAANNGEPVCPHCGSTHCWSYKSRPVFKCRVCERQFSVTSGTMFANRKLPLRDYLMAIAIFVNAHKGVSALQLSRDLNVQYKTAFVMAHKIRESIGLAADQDPLEGVVEVDGAYFGGYIKPKNVKAKRIDRRLAKNQNGKRRCVFVIKERNGRTRPVVIRTESADDISRIMNANISKNALVHADEHPAYDVLHSQFAMQRINHSVCYSDGESCTNQAESWFSRLRRAEIGQFHRMGGKHLLAYAQEMAFRDNHRRKDNGTVMNMLLGLCLNAPQSHVWNGYWQGNKRHHEVLA